MEIDTESFEEDGIPYHDFYLTRESIEQQMTILWGSPVKWLPTRFYFFLSNDKNLKRIYFGDYLDMMYNILYDSEKREQ